MKSGKWSVVVSALVLVSVSLPLAAKGPPAIAPIIGRSEAPSLSVPDGFFTENAGQVSNEQVRFYSSGDVQAGFAESAVLIKLVERDHSRPIDFFEESMRGSQVQRDDISSSRGVMVRITFPGSNKVMPQGVQEMSHRSNYFIGNDPSEWTMGVRSYREIVYRDLYDGIDLSYATQDGQLKYEFILDPGADPAIITVSYEGVEGIRLDGSGELAISTALGELRDGKPISYQSEKKVECAFVQRGPLSFGFGCGGRDPSRQLVIDPLVYSTFLGGAGYDWGQGVAIDSSGNAYVAGYTASADFPVKTGSFDITIGGLDDIFVAKLNGAGSDLLYSTFIGGGSYDQAVGIAIDSSGNAYVTGHVYSTDFPATPGSFDTSFNGNGDAFVAKLNAAGNDLLYATFLGGGSLDWSNAIAVDSGGNAYVTGETDSTDFPAKAGSFDTTYSGGYCCDGFVVKLNSVGNALVYSTFLGGSGIDWGHGLAVDSFGSLYVSGLTNSTDFPVTPGSFDTTYNGGGGDVYLAKLNAAGSALVYAAFLGGSDIDWGIGLTVDSSGLAYLTGNTLSSDFTTTPGSFDTTYNGGPNDAFVAKVDAAGSALVYSTLLGGGIDDYGSAIVVDSSGLACVIGRTDSADFPVTPGSFDTNPNTEMDVFVAMLSAMGNTLVYSTFLGGNTMEEGTGIAIDSSGNAYISGTTYSVDFPTAPGSFDTTHNGVSDAFVAKLDLSVLPVLSATGESNYMTDGLDPETGIPGVTSFVYRVNYTDTDNETPLAGDPKVHILKGGIEISGSPFSMTAANPADTTYTDGKLYTYSTTLSTRATDYAYYFSASNDTGSAAMDWPNPPADAPDVLNRGPTADAGPDQLGRFRNEVVNLDGTGSTDPDGDALTFSWTQTVGPAVVLTGGNTATPSFTPTAAGTYTFELTVDDGFAGGTDVDTVAVTVVNHPPVAYAGGPYTCRPGETITLDGSLSTDLDGDVLIYQWTVYVGSVVTLSGRKPTFTCPTAEGTSTVSLTVSDPGGLSDTGHSQLSIQPARGVAVDWTWLIVVAIAVAAVLLILFFLIRRRRREEETKQQEEAREMPPKPPG